MIAHRLPLLRPARSGFVAALTFRPRAGSPLYPILCSREVLGAADYFVLADMLGKHDPSPQVAGPREPAFIDSLQEELESRRYRPGVVSRLLRGPFDPPLRLLSFVKDRVVHTALLLVLEAALAEGLQNCNKISDTLAALRTTVRRGSRDFDAFDLDGRDARGGVSYQTLLRLVVAHVHDGDVRRLVRLFLKAPVVDVRACDWRTVA